MSKEVIRISENYSAYIEEARKVQVKLELLKTEEKKLQEYRRTLIEIMDKLVDEMDNKTEVQKLADIIVIKNIGNTVSEIAETIRESNKVLFIMRQKVKELIARDNYYNHHIKENNAEFLEE